MKSLLDKMFPSSIDAITPMVRREREMYREEKDNADRRLKMLRTAHEDAKTNGHCHFCLIEYWVDYSEWRHADGCELEAEAE